MATQVDQVARVLGPEWQGLGLEQIGARASGLEQAVRFMRALTSFMIDHEVETAGDAVQAVTTRRGAAAEWEIGA